MKGNGGILNIFECEAKNGIVFPASFKEMLNRANAKWLNESREWWIDNWDMLIEQNAFGLFIGDFKMFPFERVAHYIQVLREGMEDMVKYSDSAVHINPEYQLVPFARTVGGDLYCFCGNIVVLYEHEGDFEVYANDFEELIFSQLAWLIIDGEEDKDSEFIKKNSEVLSNSYVEILESFNTDELQHFVMNIRLPECPEFII